MKKSNILISVVVVFVVGAVAFYGGMRFRGQQISNRRGNRPFTTDDLNKQGNTGRKGNFVGARPVKGEIISQDDNSITVKMKDGSTKIVLLSDQTIINKSSEGSKSDLTTGKQITTFGTENSDGSVTAKNISIGGGIVRDLLW